VFTRSAFSSELRSIEHSSAQDKQQSTHNRLTYSLFQLCVLGVTASTCVHCLTDDIRNFFHSFRLWIISYRRYSATYVLLKGCMVDGLDSTSVNKPWYCNCRTKMTTSRQIIISDISALQGGTKNRPLATVSQKRCYIIFHKVVY